MSNNNISDTLEFFMLVSQIKHQKRTGWTHHGIKKVESVSDHMYRMAIMTMLLDSKDLNTTRCMKLAIVHDLAECIVGDITPFCGISKEEKHRREQDAMEKLVSLLPKDANAGKDILDLWQEYEAQLTPEAKAVKDLDRFEMIMQAFEYEKDELQVGDLQMFFDTTAGKFELPQVQHWVAELNRIRKSTTETSKAV